jgi:hypothetical protein
MNMPEYATCAYSDILYESTGIADELDKTLYVPA